MRKITLLFLSMFLMVGTMVAQDAAFGLKAVTPSSEQPTTRVDNVTLVFTKDVVATMPEGGIAVVNNETKESVKLANIYENPYMDKNMVIFEFEKKVVVGKDGKEEEQSLYIDTPGTYSFTIPAGCIKSVDGEEFAEQTFTFSVVGTFSMVSYSPTTTDKLEKIELTFSEEIVKVIMPSYGLSVLDGYWTPVSSIKNDVVISDDKKTVTLELETPVTTPGNYALDVYQGMFVSANGINAYSFVSLSVVDNTPSFSTNYENGDKVKELGNLEITFNNVNEVKLVEGADPVTVYLPGGSEGVGTATLADGKITVAFEQAFTEEGDYTFVIPAGMFTMDGVANEARELTVNLYSFEIIPLEVVSVTPVAGPVDSLVKIVVKYNQLVSLYYDEEGRTLSNAIKLTCDDKEYTLNYCPSGYNLTDEIEYLVNGEWTGYEWACKAPVTAPGTYKLNVADIIVNYGAETYTDEWGYTNYKWHEKGKYCEGVVMWTIADNGNAIKVTDAEAGEQAIYDLLGRRIEKITGAGIYIVNGKKVVIK